NVQAAADALGIPRRTPNQKMRKYGLRETANIRPTLRCFGCPALCAGLASQPLKPRLNDMSGGGKGEAKRAATPNQPVQDSEGPVTGRHGPEGGHAGPRHQNARITRFTSARNAVQPASVARFMP